MFFTPKSHLGVGGGGGVRFQLSTYDAEFKSPKIPKFHFFGGGGSWVLGSNFQLLMLSPNLLKSQSLISGGRGWDAIFDAESKSAKIQKSYIWEGGGGGCQFPTSDAESKFAKKKISVEVLLNIFQVFGQKVCWFQKPRLNSSRTRTTTKSTIFCFRF